MEGFGKVWILTSQRPFVGLGLESGVCDMYVGVLVRCDAVFVRAGGKREACEDAGSRCQVPRSSLIQRKTLNKVYDNSLNLQILIL